MELGYSEKTVIFFIRHILEKKMYETTLLSDFFTFLEKGRENSPKYIICTVFGSVILSCNIYASFIDAQNLLSSTRSILFIFPDALKINCGKITSVFIIRRKKFDLIRPGYK